MLYSVEKKVDWKVWSLVVWMVWRMVVTMVVQLEQSMAHSKVEQMVYLTAVKTAQMRDHQRAATSAFPLVYMRAASSVLQLVASMAAN